MGRACSTNREKMNAYRILVVNLEGKRPQGRPTRRWVGSIKLDLRGREDKMLWIGSVWLRIGTS
jgi:hypothetical protein